MKKAAFGFLLLIAAAGLAPAQTYSLPDYLARVERFSRDLHLVRQDAAAAELAVKQARSALFPTVAAQVGYTRNLLDVEQPFPVAADASGGGDRFPLVYRDVDANYDNEISAGLAVSQSLFNMKALAALKYGKEYNNLTGTVYREAKRSILTAAKKLYYQAVLLQEVLSVKEASERNDFATYENMKKRFEAGMAQELEMLRAEVAWRSKLPEITQARKNLEIAMIHLKTFAGMDLDAPLSLAGTIDRFPELPAEVSLSETLSRRSDYELLLRQKRLAEISIDLAKADFYPVASASLSYGRQGYGNSGIDDRTVDVLQVGVKIALPVYTGGARLAQLENERIKLEKSDTSLGKKRDEILAEMKRLHLTLREARERIDSARGTLETAEKAYRIAQTAMENGLATQLELSESSVQLEQTRLLYLSSVYDYLSVFFDWEKAMGEEISGA